MTKSNIAERAMLVSINMRKAQRTRKDDNETQALLDAHNADKDSAAVIGVLFPGDPRIRKIDQAFNAARSWLYSVSFPYGSMKGVRIIPAEKFFDIQSELTKHKDNVRAAVRDAAGQYSTMLDEARQKRNGMFNQSDYPDSPQEFENCFGVEVSFLPFPDRNHILVKLGDEAVSELGNTIDSQINEALATATKKLAERLHVLLRRVADNCSKEKAIIRDSLVGNLREFVDWLPAMNLNNSKELLDLKLDIQQLADLEPDTLKKDVKKRKEASVKATDILKKLSQYGLNK